jgi:uncharacterized protein (DUF58 family)
MSLPLPGELVVAPRLGPAEPVLRHADIPDGDGGPPTPASAGEPRAVRSYQHGDNRRLVHWPSTAHHGELMVKEMESSIAEPVTVTVVLPSDFDAAERVAESALGTVVALLDQGIPVVLATNEPRGPRDDQVDDRLQAGRRLARAVPQTAGEPG